MKRIALSEEHGGNDPWCVARWLVSTAVRDYLDLPNLKADWRLKPKRLHSGLQYVLKSCKAMVAKVNQFFVPYLSSSWPWCQLGNQVSLLVAYRCIRVLLPTIGCSIFVISKCMHGTKTYSYKQGFPVLSQKSLRMTKEVNSWTGKPFFLHKGQCLLEQSVYTMISLTTCCWRCTERRGNFADNESRSTFHCLTF